MSKFLTLETPHLHTSPGPQFGDDQRRFQGIPSIERAPLGRRWAAWYCGGPDQPGEGPGNYIVLVSSDDDDAPWSSPRLVIEPPPPDRVFDPVLWLDPQGRLWLFWAHSHDVFDGRGGVWAIVTQEPDASAPRWSSPHRLGDGVMMNKPTVLSSGEWLLPVAFWGHGTFEERGEPHGSHLLISRNNGETFLLHHGPQIPEVTYNEHMIVELHDGSVWMLVRAQWGVAQSFSHDGGTTWQQWSPALFANVNSRFFIRRLKSGNLLLVKHGAAINERPQGIPYQTDRSHLTAFLSLDEGQTWQGGLVLDERERISYPDGYQAPDSSISIIYDRERQSAKEILLARFTEADILAQKWQSPCARQALLVNRAASDSSEERH